MIIVVLDYENVVTRNLKKAKKHIRVTADLSPLRAEDTPTSCLRLALTKGFESGLCGLWECAMEVMLSVCLCQVFQEVQALVTSCIDGFNVCIFAYGQTGSGKTYTMEVRPVLPVVGPTPTQPLSN